MIRKFIRNGIILITICITGLQGKVSESKETFEIIKQKINTKKFNNNENDRIELDKSISILNEIKKNAIDSVEIKKTILKAYKIKRFKYQVFRSAEWKETANIEKKLCEEILIVEPDNIEMLMNYSKLVEPKEQYKILLKILSIDPDNIDAHFRYGMGQIYYHDNIEGGIKTLLELMKNKNAVKKYSKMVISELRRRNKTAEIKKLKEQIKLSQEN